MTVLAPTEVQPFLDEIKAAVIDALKAEGVIRDERPLLTLKEAGVRLGIAERSVRALVNHEGGQEPRLPSITIGKGSRRVVPAELDQYIADRLASRGESDA